MGQSTHILVIDDHDDVRDTIVAILTDCHYRVSAVASGALMCAFLETGDAVDCAVLDAIMPGEANISSALHLKEAGIPVVMISGSPDDAEHAEKHGLQLLPKPFRMQELCDAVNKALASGECGQRVASAQNHARSISVVAGRLKSGGSSAATPAEVDMLLGFKQFMLRGNVLDLAVAVVMGAAFGAVVTALVKELITPLIAAVVGKPDFSAIAFTVHDSRFPIGHFINAIVSFILIGAAVYFFIVLPVNKLLARMRRGEAAPDPTTEKCPECLSDVPIAARRCAFCTSPRSVKPPNAEGSVVARLVNRRRAARCRLVFGVMVAAPRPMCPRVRSALRLQLRGEPSARSSV